MITVKQAIETPCLTMNVDEYFLNAYRQIAKYWGVSVVNAFMSGDILIIDIYLQSYSRTNENYYLGKKVDDVHFFGDRKPNYRLFIETSEKNYLTMRYGNEKRSKASLDFIFNQYPIIETPVYIGDSNQIILNALCQARYKEQNDGFHCVLKWQNDIIQEKKDLKYMKMQKLINYDMRQVKTTPIDFEDFIENNVLKDFRYAFFSIAKSKRIAHCSHCGYTFELENIYKNAWQKGGYEKKPNNFVICPECKSCLVVLAEKILPAFWSQRRQAVLLQSLIDNSGYVIRHFEVVRKIKKNDVQKTEYVEFCRQIYKNGNNKAKNYYYGFYKRTGRLGWHYPKDIHVHYWGATDKSFKYYNIYSDYRIYVTGIDKEIKDTDIRYCQISKFYKFANLKEYEVDDYIAEFLQKPFIEYLIKDGAYKLACSFASKYREPKYFKGKSIKEILGVSSEDYKFIVKHNLDEAYLRLIQILHKNQAVYTLEQLKTLVHLNFRENFLSNLLAVANLTKILSYIEKNKAGQNFIRDWEDVYDNMKKLNLPITKKGLLFSNDFKRTHDNLYKQVIDLTNYENNDKFKEVCLVLKEKIEYFDKETGLCVLIPDSINSLIYEGKFLGHCVGTYSEKIIKGNSIVVFIRKIDEPETPLYTAELSKQMSLIQCQKKGNRDAKDEIKTFLNSWLETIKPKTKKKLQSTTKSAA